MATLPKHIKHKENRFSKVYGFETKTSDNNDLIRGGFIATTHLDSGFYNEDRGVYIRDKIAKETLNKWANEINAGNPKSNKVSVNHNRKSHVAGVGIKGTAEVVSLKDGEFGLYVDTLIDKTEENFDDTEYRVEKGLLDSYSIEFVTQDYITGDYIDGAVHESSDNGGIVRTLLPNTSLEGWTLASQPMNEHAIMIKEIKLEQKNEEQTIPVDDSKLYLKNKVEVPQMAEEETAPIVEPVVEPTAPVVEEQKTKELPIEDKELLQWAKEKKATEAKEKEFKSIHDSILSEVKESMKDIKVENKVQINKDDKIESKEMKSFKACFTKDSNLDVKEQFRRAGDFATSLGLISNDGVKASSSITEVKGLSGKFAFETKTSGCKVSIEKKGLGIDTNVQEDADYYQNAAELSDVYDPVIYNALNEKTVTYNLLAKDDYSMHGGGDVQFRQKTVANTTAAAYTGNAVVLGNTGRQKLQTKFKKYAVGVEVDGDMIAAARGGPISNVFGQEVMDATESLLSVINVALFAEVGLETASGVIGFEFIADNSGNGTMYGLTRSTANKLSPDANGDTYIDGASVDITLAKLRAAKRQPIEEGAELGNLVFITSPIQGDKFRGIYDALQRTVPTSSRFGFEGRPEFDGIPIFEDKDCTDDNWFLIDLNSHRIGMWVPPTLEMLGKDSDAQKGFIKTYFCTYNRLVRALVMIYDCKTS